MSGRQVSMKRVLDISLRYGVAALAVGVVLALKLLLDPWITAESPFLLLAGAVVVSAWFGGLGPGLLATFLGALCANYFFFPRKALLPGWVWRSCRYYFLRCRGF